MASVSSPSCSCLQITFPSVGCQSRTVSRVGFSSGADLEPRVGMRIGKHVVEMSARTANANRGRCPRAWWQGCLVWPGSSTMSRVRRRLTAISRSLRRSGITGSRRALSAEVGPVDAERTAFARARTRVSLTNGCRLRPSKSTSLGTERSHQSINVGNQSLQEVSSSISVAVQLGGPANKASDSVTTFVDRALLATHGCVESVIPAIPAPWRFRCHP